MRASLFGILWGLLGGSLSACGAPVARPEPGRAPSVLLISVDGLSPDLLRQHLARPQSQGPDRGLRRLIEGAAGARVGEALTPLPSGPSAGAEALLKTPQGPLFEGVGGGLSVGFEAPGAEIMRPQGDEARIKAAAAGLAAHRLVALRLTGLVEAMSEGGVAAGLPALAVLDQRLGALVDALPPYALVILTATHGAAALPSEKTARDKAAFARFLKIDEARLEPAGGLLFVSGCQGEIIAQLGGMPFIAGLYQRGEGGALLRFDPNAGLMRPATPADAPPHAQIQAALASREGVCAAVARRDEGYEFTAPGFDGGKIGWGGPAAARVALIIAGPITPGAFDAPVPLAEAPALAAASLGAPVTSALQARLSPSPEARGLPSPLRARPDLAAWVSTPPYRAARLTALEATPIPDARPLPFKLDVAEAAAVAGALGLEAISFGREVLSTTPHLARFGAPAYFVGRAEPGTTKALSALALADRHLSLGRAALAFEALIDADLKALPSAARPWAEILLALSARLSPPEGDASPPAFPEIAQGQPAAAFNQLAQGLVWPNQGPHPWTSLVGAAPYAQLPALVEETRFCAQDYAARRTRRLAAAAALRADWPGLAAYILSAHIGEGAIEARRAAVIEVLDLLDDPRAAWRRGEILSGLLNRFLFTQGLAAQLPELHRRAARAYLLHLQGEILADPHPERNQGRLNGLLSGAAQVESALQEQTIRLAAGDEGNLATAILRGVLSQGGLLSFLNPEFLQHLVRVRASVAEALAPVLAKPLAALTPEERLTRALLAQLDALLAGLQGQMPAAKARLSEAEALLDDPRFEAAYEAALKLKPEAEAPLIAWGRASLALTRVALGIIAAIEQDKATATARLTAGVEILHAMSLALLDAQGLAALRGHADALAALLKAATRLTALGQGEAPDQALLAEVFGVAAGLRLDVPEGEAAGVGRWLVLGGLILRDVVWIIDVLARGEAADLKALAGAEAAWAALRAGWAPESRVGQALLSLSEVAQALLPKLPALKDGAAEAWLGALTAVEAQGLRAQLSHALSEAELRAKLRAGEVEWIFLHYLRKLLDLNLITLKDPQTLLAFIDGENRALLALMGEDASGPTRPLIALLQATLHPGEAGVTWAEKGKAWSAGTVFEEAPFLWDLLAWERVAAPARLEAIAAACPPIKPSVDLVAARLEARAGRRAEALRRLMAARQAARRAGAAHPNVQLNFNLTEGEAIITSTVHMPALNSLLRHRKGSFQLGAGASTKGPEGPMGLSWRLGPTADARGLAIDTLAMEIMMGLEGGDEVMIDRGLSRLGALLLGLDPRWLDEAPGAATEADLTWLPPTPPKLMSPLTLAWLATLAELRGHQKLGRWLLSMTLGQVKGGWPDEAMHTRGVCEGEAASEGEPPLLKHLRCHAPWLVIDDLPEGADRALAALVHAHVKGLMEGQRPATWPKLLKAASQAAPQLVPAWVIALNVAQGQAKPPKGAPQGLIEALKVARGEALARFPEGYQCGLALTRLEAGDQRDPNKHSVLLEAVEPCGPVTFKVQAYFEAGLASKRGEEGYRWIAPTLRTLYLYEHLKESRGAVWAHARRIVFDQAWSVDRRQKIAEVVALARSLGDGEEALWWRAAGLLLGEGGPAEAARLLEEAEAAGVSQPAARRLLARLAYGPKAGYQAAAQAFFSGR